VDSAGGHASWVTWVVLLVGTAAFWAVVYVTVRALLAGRNIASSHRPDQPRHPDSQEPT
jgi:hypothetical protein